MTKPDRPDSMRKLVEDLAKPEFDSFFPNQYEGGLVKYMTEYTGGSIRHQAIHMIDVQRALHDFQKDARRAFKALDEYHEARSILKRQAKKGRK